MPGRYDAVIGDTLTLEAQFTLEGELQDVYSIARVDLANVAGDVVQTKGPLFITYLGPGHYQVTFDELTSAGDFNDVWVYTPVEDAEQESLILQVTVADIEGTSPEVPPVEEPVPAIGAEHICRATHTFYDASGNPFRGVYVRFSPEVAAENIVEGSLIAQIAEDSSDANGHISLPLIRGAKGLLAISGIGIVRRVQVPNVERIDLLDLVASADDLFEVQKPEFVTLPRRS